MIGLPLTQNALFVTSSYSTRLWQAVVDVPPSLQRIVEFLLRVVELLHHVVDIVQLMQTFYNAL